MQTKQSSLRLDQLPIEIITCILNCLDPKELVVIAQLNSWFRNFSAPFIADRIRESTKKDGWRIHITLLTRSEMSDGISYFHELSLLGELQSIDPRTLRLTFDVYPVGEDGFSLVPLVSPIDKQTVFFANTDTKMELLVSFAKVAQHRMEYVDQAGVAILDTTAMETQPEDELEKQVRLNDQDEGFLLNCCIRHVPSEQLIAPTDIKFMVDQYRDELKPIVVEITSFRISPMWWVRQMTRPTVDYMLQHSLW
ncbi:hypothetical protein EC973_007735 [Apophysomyces ossiformis]|uniref:F-box domain-containing protein n=1 Tax=Apophysomyces ossiformis TaxID=679940 RepID=A0A8H7C0L3_9FUNG|nr:hypothetical protein EC973_007735 [Apophysomyces ossiformis]